MGGAEISSARPKRPIVMPSAAGILQSANNLRDVGDEVLLQNLDNRIRNRERDREFVRRYQRIIWYEVRQQIRHERELQEEAVAQTWIKVFDSKRKKPCFPPSNATERHPAVAAWIRTVARRAAIDVLRRRRPEEEPLGPDTEPATREAAPDVRASNADDLRRLHRAIRKLPSDLQAILMLVQPKASCNQGDLTGLGTLTYEEAAKVLGYRDHNRVYSLLKRALELLEEELGVESQPDESASK